MDFKGMVDKAKQMFQQRGGAKAAKEDAEELRGVAQEQGSFTEKGKDAAEAIREPGAHNPNPQDPQSPQSPAAGDAPQSS